MAVAQLPALVGPPSSPSLRDEPTPPVGLCPQLSSCCLAPELQPCSPAALYLTACSYYDSSRKDGLMPAARKRTNLTAADAVQLQQDAAAKAKAEAGSSGRQR